jgi:2-keto-4-pentenoate hydratase
MALTTSERQEAAEILRVAEETQVAVVPLVRTFPHLGIEDTYEI